MRYACALWLAWLWTLGQGVALATTPEDPDWPLYRHDTWLSGRSPLRGRIITPRRLAQYDLRAWDSYLLARYGRPAGKPVRLQAKELAPGWLAMHQAEWNAGPLLLDLAGDGQLKPIVEQNYTRYARLFPEAKGWQKIHVEDYFGTGTPEQRKIYLFTFEPGRSEPRLLWESGPYGELMGTLLVVTDIEADGQLDIVGNSWGRLFVWDARTGQQKRFLQWHPPMRDYGFFAATKFKPTDRFPQFVIIGDFVMHIGVIRNDGQNLSVGWRKPIEEQLGAQKKALRPLVNSVLDVDGDREQEIAVNLFNDTGDERWHFLIWDAATGRVEADQPDLFVYAAEDVDGDNVPELFCGETKAGLLCDPGRLSVARVSAGHFATLLRLPEPGMWEFTYVRQLPLNVDTMAAEGRRTIRLADVDGDGVTEFFARQKDALVIYGHTATGLREKGRIIGPRLSIVGYRPRGRGERGADLLLRASLGAEEKADVQFAPGQLRLVSCAARPGPINPPIAGHFSRSPGPALCIEDALERIHCLVARENTAFQASSASASSSPAAEASLVVQRRWALPGRSISADRANYYGLVAADLDGLDGKEIVFGRPAEDGSAEIVAIRGDGRLLWQHFFPRFVGRVPPWNFNGLTHWTAGRFTGRQGYDIAVSLRRGNMHTDEIHLLDGRTGREIWAGVNSADNPSADRVRGFGGAITAAYDWNGDGAEDILCAYPDEYFVACGKTGRLLFQRWALEIFPGGWVAYAVPVIGRFGPDGTLAVLWTQGGYRRGVMTLYGEKLWAFDYKDGEGPMPGIADVNGDGKLEGLSRQKGVTTCYWMETGEILWTLPDYPQDTDCVSADINGDDREEFVFGSGSRLVAVGEEAGQPRLLWSLSFSALLGSPIIADVTGDGQPEIIFMTRDGWLQIVG